MSLRMTGGLVVLAAVSLAACTGGTTGPRAAFDQQLNFDVAMVAADAALDDLGAMKDAADRDARFAGLERSRIVTFFDVAGNEQEAFDELTTASIHLVTEISGEFGREGWSASVLRTRDMTISGLEGEETTRIANGSGAGTVSRSRHADEFGTRTYEMSGSSTIEDVVHPVPRDENSYPLSGTITRNITVTITNGPNGDETRSRSVVITFDGTQFATLTVDGESFEVDLAADRDRQPFRGRRGR